MNIYIRAVRLPFLTGSLVPVLLAAGQALTQKNHMALGSSCWRASLSAIFQGGPDR